MGEDAEGVSNTSAMSQDTEQPPKSAADRFSDMQASLEDTLRRQGIDPEAAVREMREELQRKRGK